MRFYVLKEASAASPEDEEAGTEALKVEGFNVGEAPRCDACGRYIGMLAWLPPYRVEIETWGREFGDLAFKSVGSSLLVSQRFWEIYENQHLKGLSGFDPVEVAKVTKHKKFAGVPPQYLKADIVRSQAAIDLAASGFEWREPRICRVCRLGGIIKRWKRVIIEQNTWSGEDIFIARGLPGTFITSRRFKEVCEAESIQNAVFVPAEQYAHDFYPWEKQSYGVS